MSALHISPSTNAHDDRAVGVLLHRDDALLLTYPEAVEGFLQRALNPDRAQAVLGVAHRDRPDSGLQEGTAPPGPASAGGGAVGRLPESHARAEARCRHHSVPRP